MPCDWSFGAILWQPCSSRGDDHVWSCWRYDGCCLWEHLPVGYLLSQVSYLDPNVTVHHESPQNTWRFLLYSFIIGSRAMKPSFTASDAVTRLATARKWHIKHGAAHTYLESEQYCRSSCARTGCSCQLLQNQSSRFSARHGHRRYCWLHQYNAAVNLAQLHLRRSNQTPNLCRPLYVVALELVVASIAPNRVAG